MSLNPISLIEKAINEHGSAAILKERLSLAADQFKQLEEENRKLKSVNAALEGRVSELSRKLETGSVPRDFVESRGVLFRRQADGKIEKDAYCPTCKTVMFSLSGVTPFHCSKCKFSANFTGREIDRVISAIT